MLLVILVGVVTGAFGATVLAAWFLRSIGDPRAQGPRVLAHILGGLAIFLGTTVYLFVHPWIHS